MTSQISLTKNVEVRLFVSSIPYHILTIIFIPVIHVRLCVQAIQMQNFWYCWPFVGSETPLGHLSLGIHQDGPQEISPHVTYGCHYTPLST